jgi:hypothetical protein
MKTLLCSVSVELDSTFKLTAPKFWKTSEIVNESFCNFPSAVALNASLAEWAKAGFFC